MRITCKTKDTLTLDALTEFQGGLKKRDDSDFEKIRKSIEKYGFATPFFVWKRGRVNYVLDGHGRLETLKRMQADGEEIPPLPVVYVDCKSEADAKNLLLRINSTYGRMTAESVIDFIGGIEIDIKEIALPSGTLDIEIPTENNIDTEKLDEIPENAESVCKRGDIWKLGEHRLMCGDSTIPDDVKILTGVCMSKLLFTSPPYSDMRTYNGGKDLRPDNLAKFIGVYAPFVEYQAVNLGLQSKDLEILPYWNNYIDAAHEAGLKLMAWNVWDKKSCGSIGQQHRIIPCRHEWIFLFGTKWTDINETWEKKAGDGKMKKKRRQKDGTMKIGSTGDISKSKKKMESVLAINYETGAIRSEHPAVFPVALPSEYIKAFTDEGDSVVEPFGGSGTTLIACEQLKRKCYMMELDERYCDVIIKRWEALTGGKAEKIKTIKTNL